MNNDVDEDDGETYKWWVVPPPQPVSAPRGLSGLFRGGPSAYEPLDTTSLTPNTVLLNVYDVSDLELFQKINRVSTINDKVLIGGVYHAGVEVFGLEWSFGYTEEDITGVSRCAPRCHTQHNYRATVVMGATELSEQEVGQLLRSMMGEWRGPDYHLIHQNCLAFASAFCKELGVRRLPGWVDRFGRTASTIDTVARRAASGVQNTREIAQREVPKLAEIAQINAQTLGGNFKTWGQGLFAAATRALGDDPSAKKTKNNTLQNALRRRGGVRTSVQGAPVELAGKDVLGEPESPSSSYVSAAFVPADSVLQAKGEGFLLATDPCKHQADTGTLQPECSPAIIESNLSSACSTGQVASEVGVCTTDSSKPQLRCESSPSQGSEFAAHRPPE